MFTDSSQAVRSGGIADVFAIIWSSGDQWAAHRSATEHSVNPSALRAGKAISWRANPCRRQKHGAATHSPQIVPGERRLGIDCHQRVCSADDALAYLARGHSLP